MEFSKIKVKLFSLVFLFTMMKSECNIIKWVKEDVNSGLIKVTARDALQIMDNDSVNNCPRNLNKVIEAYSGESDDADNHNYKLKMKVCQTSCNKEASTRSGRFVNNQSGPCEICTLTVHVGFFSRAFDVENINCSKNLQ